MRVTAKATDSAGNIATAFKDVSIGLVVSETSVGLYGLYGVPVGTVLADVWDARKVITGSTDPNNPTVITLTRYHGNVDVRGYVSFQWCDFFMRPTPATILRPCVTTTEATTGYVTISDSDIHADCSDPANQPSERTSGVIGTNTTVLRCKVWDVCDGLYPTKGNYIGRYNWVGKLLYNSPQSGRELDTPWSRSHNDAVQIADGNNYLFEYNVFEAYNDVTVGQGGVYDTGIVGSVLGYYPGGYSMANACVMLGLKAGMGVTLRGNVFRGGRAGVNMAGTPDGGAVVLDSNVYGGYTDRANYLIVPKVWGDTKVLGMATERMEDGSPVVPKRY